MVWYFYWGGGVLGLIASLMIGNELGWDFPHWLAWGSFTIVLGLILGLFICVVLEDWLDNR